LSFRHTKGSGPKGARSLHMVDVDNTGGEDFAALFEESLKQDVVK
jgi:hypothetical protein